MKLQIAIDQPVAIYQNSHYDFAYVVQSITPKRGDITVARAGDGLKRKFDAFGKELGNSWSSLPAVLVTDMAAARAHEEDIARRWDAASALSGIHAVQSIGSGWAKAALVEEAERLQTLLDQARAKIDLLSK